MIFLTGPPLKIASSKIINKPLPEDDPRKRRPDITLAMKELSWEPKIELDDGLERTIKYFIETIKNKNNKRGINAK